MSETITADHLNATHLGKRITINGKHGTVVSGKLKEISADYAHQAQFHDLLHLQRRHTRTIGVQERRSHHPALVESAQ